MTTVAVPVRSFRAGMTRLGAAVGEQPRQRLGRYLAARTLACVRMATKNVVVVSEDDEVIAWAESESVRTYSDSGEGLDGVGEIIAAAHSPWLLLHSDLPHLLRDDVERLLDGIRRGATVIAPSYDGGTTALGSTHGRFRFAYGAGSFRRHAARAAAAGSLEIVASPGLSLDVDRPRDLGHFDSELWS